MFSTNLMFAIIVNVLVYGVETEVCCPFIYQIVTTETFTRLKNFWNYAAGVKKLDTVGNFVKKGTGNITKWFVRRELAKFQKENFQSDQEKVETAFLKLSSKSFEGIRQEF